MIKRTNKDLQNTTQKTKWSSNTNQTPLKIGGELLRIVRDDLCLGQHRYGTHFIKRSGLWHTYQGRTQDFKLRGGRGGSALKKIAPSGGRRENFGGISCEKSRFYAKKKILFFPILGGRAPGAPPLESAPAYIMCCVSLFVFLSLDLRLPITTIIWHLQTFLKSMNNMNDIDAANSWPLVTTDICFGILVSITILLCRKGQ